MRYVLNVILNKNKDIALLIKKNRPEWQAGKYNFVGGKVEGIETTREAAIRETMEECGLMTNPSHIGNIIGSDFHIQVFRSVIDSRFMDEATQNTDEELENFCIYEWDDELANDCVDNVIEILYIARKDYPQFFEFQYY